MDRVLVGTLNIRNLADRWDERLPLLLADMAALQPDLIGLQEVVYPLQQDRLLGAAGEGRYEAHRAWAGRPEYGNALLVKAPLVAGAVERLDLGASRSALRVVVPLPGGARLAYVVTHLHHVPADEGLRDQQVEGLLAWLGGTPPHDALVVVGDFNAEPDEPAAARMRAAGFRSAYAEANGADPAVTWPSGIVAEAMDDDGDPGCLDYVWVRGECRIESARLAFDRPAVGDPTLYPSDHLGIAARLVVRMTGAPLRLAHRGDWRVAPENTLAAFEAAMRIPGCDGVELDVRLSADGVPVVLHDDTLARVQRRPGKARDLDAAALEAAGVPRLATALGALDGAWVDVELKGDDHGDPTAAVLRRARGEAPADAVISSFDGPSLAAMADRLPGWARWLNALDLGPGTLSLALGLGCRAVAVLWGAITPASVRRAHDAGLEVAAWTVRRRATRDRLARLGVVACCVEAAALGEPVPVPVAGAPDDRRPPRARRRRRAGGRQR